MPELADVVRVAGQAYLGRFGDRVLPSHRRVLRDVADCRTPVLGGQLFTCDCGASRPVYHSCRNRHCPKCQGGDAERWLERQRGLLLPTAYGLATCTLPAELRAVARSHQRLVYAVVLREAARALLDVVADPAHVGGLGAVTAVLHTWTRALLFHPHVHMLFPAGALAADGESWKKPRKRSFLAPGFALGKRFRERVEVAFRKAGLHHLVPERVWRKRWVANVKKVGSGEQTLLYLSRYVFRVAISDDRVERFDGSQVTYRWTDSATGQTRRATLPAVDFLARFLQHVLPRGFKKVRHFGLWAPAHRARLAVVRAILDDHRAAVTPVAHPEQGHSTSSSPLAWVCRSCGVVSSNPPREIPRTRAPP